MLSLRTDKVLGVPGLKRPVGLFARVISGAEKAYNRVLDTIDDLSRLCIMR